MSQHVLKTLPFIDRGALGRRQLNQSVGKIERVWLVTQVRP